MDVNLREIRPYGDTLSDGAMLLSFTLPLACGPLAKEAALRFVAKMGLAEADVVHMADLGEGSRFLCVRKTRLSIDATEIRVTQVEAEVWDRPTCDEKIRSFSAARCACGACMARMPTRWASMPS
jgi:beta-lysine 5,6-aminomutase beta subunit